MIPSPSKSTSSKQPQAVDEARFYPSVFRYRCRGALHLSSDEQGSSGLCRGIQSRMEHVKDLAGQSTYPQSVQIFQQAVTAPKGGDGTDDEHENISHDSLRKLMQTQAMIYDQQRRQAETIKNTTRNGGDNEEPWHDWSCYGSTEVHLLVLRDVKTQEETLAGVAPDCRLGVSLRDVGTNKGGDTVATIRLGPVEVSLANHYEFPEESADHNNRKQEGIQRQESQHVATSAPERRPTSDDDDNDTITKIWETTGKVAGSMKRNAIVLKDAMSDDFPSRMLDASLRVAGQFGKTVDRTAGLMGSVYKMWRDDDDDHDD